MNEQTQHGILLSREQKEIGRLVPNYYFYYTQTKKI